MVVVLVGIALVVVERSSSGDRVVGDMAFHNKLCRKVCG